MEAAGVEPASARAVSRSWLAASLPVFPGCLSVVVPHGCHSSVSPRAVFFRASPGVPARIGVTSWCWLGDESQVRLGHEGGAELGSEHVLRTCVARLGQRGTSRPAAEQAVPDSNVETSTPP